MTSQRCSVMLLFYLYPYTLMPCLYIPHEQPVPAFTLYFCVSAESRVSFFIHAGLLPFLLRFLMLERTVLWGCCWGWAIFPGPLHSHGSCQQVPPALLNDQMREGGCAVLLISPITVQRPLLGLPNLHCIETRLLPMAAFLLTNGFETYSFLPIWEQFFEATHP